VLAPGLALGCGLFCAGLYRFRLPRLAVALGLLAVLAGVPGDYLRGWVIEQTSPAFFRRVEALRSVPEPLLAFEPAFAVYANKTLTFHFYVADTRNLGLLGRNLDAATFRRSPDPEQLCFVRARRECFLLPGEPDVSGYAFSPAFQRRELRDLRAGSVGLDRRSASGGA